MTFLAPMAGIIAAALAAPALLLFYFLKLRRRQVRVSSTLLWAHAVQDLQVNTPFRWLRFSWLLLLQMLALLLLAGAIARPALRDDGPAGSRVVIVIDRSASMSATDGAGRPGENPITRLEEAKRRAEETVGALARRGGGWGFGGGGSGWQACVVTFAGRAEAMTGFTSDAGALREAIRGVEPTDQPADLAGLLRFIDALAGAPPDENAVAERTGVHIFSDGSFGALQPLPRPRGVDAKLVRVGPAPAAAEEVESRNNLGIVSINARRDYEDPGIVRIFARVLNAGAGGVESTVQLRVDGELADGWVLALPGAAADSGHPGEASVTFELENTVGGVALVTLARPDLLAADDSAALVLTPAGRARVLVVAPGEGGADADTYLTGVLEAMDLRDYRIVGKDAYEEMIVRSQAPGGLAIAPVSGDTNVPDLRDWDLVVFDRVRPEAMPPASLASLSFGAALPIPGMSARAVEDPVRSAETARVVSWQRTHPLLRYVSLDQLLISPPVALTTRANGPGESAGMSGDAIAWSEDGVLIEVLGDGANAAGGAKRAVVAFDIGRSNWGPDVSFPVFMSNAVEYLTLRGEATAGRFLRTTDPLQIVPAPGATTLSLDGPSPRTAAVRGNTVSFGQIERVGVYAVAGAAPGADRVAVNLVDPVESMLRTGEQLPIAGMERAMERGQEESDREIWHWFVALAFLLLTLEWFVQAWKMRV